MGGLTDRTGRNPIRLFTHVRITHPRHSYHNATGTVVRIDAQLRKVWVALPGGTVASAGHRSIEVLSVRTPNKKVS